MSTVYFENEEVRVEKIIGVGSNYPDHIQEMKGSFEPPGEFPVLFFKPPSAIIYSGGTVLKPRYSLQLDYEAECVVMIGKEGRNIGREEALGYVMGYTIGLDMTLRDIQKRCKARGEPWSIAKGFDTSAVIGPIVSASKIADPQDMKIILRVNGVVRQHASTSQMLKSIPELIEIISRYFTLKKGDLIYTGTPAGVGAVEAGDRIWACLEGYADLEVTIADAG